MISFIWTQDKNGLIGNNNKLPWRLPADLQYYKNTTMGQALVMGRKTFESIGKPLPGRKNIILTRDEEFKAEGCLVFHSKDDVLEWANHEETEVFINGGSEIYNLFQDDADRLYVTMIEHAFEGDTYFPAIDWDQWNLKSSEKGKRDERNPYDFEFKVYERI